MRSFLLVLLTILCSISCLLAKTTIIRAKLNEFPPEEVGSSLALVAINDLVFDQQLLRTEVSEEGTFEFSFELERPQDIILRAGGFQFSLLLKPGDELAITWTHVSEPEERLPADLQFLGDGAKRNGHFVAMLHSYLYYPLSELEGIDPAVVKNDCKECSPKEYQHYYSLKKAARAKHLKDYIEQLNVQDQLLLEWFDYFNTYRPVSDQLLFAFNYQQQHRKEPEKLQLLEDYNHYIETVELNVPKALICTQYLKFLRRDYRTFKQMEAAKIPNFKTRIKEDGYAKVLFNYMEKTSDGLSRSVILTHAMLDMMESSEALAKQVPPLLEEYTDVVKEEHFVREVLRKYKLLFDEKGEINLAENINVLELADGNGKDFLPDLIRRFAGKVIYIDIWSTWCGPCIREMEYYPRLLEKYAGKEVEFVFLAALSAENLWKNRVNAFDLQGYHYLLNEQQYYELEKYIKLEGFPQHIIINAKGEVVEQKGPPVFTVEGILNPKVTVLLDKLLSN